MMRAQFISIAMLAVVSVWSCSSCPAQDAKPAAPAQEAPQPAVVQDIPLQAGVAVPSEYRGYPYKSPDGLGLTHIVRNRETTEGGKKLRLNDIDDASHTILAGEIRVGFSPWAMPKNGRLLKRGIRRDWSRVTNDSLGFGSTHYSGANFLMMDDSVVFLSENTDAKVLEQLGRLKVK